MKDVLKQEGLVTLLWYDVKEQIGMRQKRGAGKDGKDAEACYWEND